MNIYWFTVTLDNKSDLNDNPAGQGWVGIDVPDLGLAVAEIQLHDPLVDLLLTVNLLKNEKKKWLTKAEITTFSSNF